MSGEADARARRPARVERTRLGRASFSAALPGDRAERIFRDGPERALPGEQRARSRVPPADRHGRSGRSVRCPAPALRQAVLRALGARVGRLRTPPGRHRDVPPHRGCRLALLAPSDDWVDRTRAPVGRARLLPEDRLEERVSPRRPGAGDLVVRRDLRAGQLHLGGGSHGGLPERDHGLDRVGLLPLRPSRSLACRPLSGGGAPALGAPSSGLPVPAGPRGLEPLGLLPRHRLPDRDGARESSSSCSRTSIRACARSRPCPGSCSRGRATRRR